MNGGAVGRPAAPRSSSRSRCCSASSPCSSPRRRRGCTVSWRRASARAPRGGAARGPGRGAGAGPRRAGSDAIRPGEACGGDDGGRAAAEEEARRQAGRGAAAGGGGAGERRGRAPSWRVAWRTPRPASPARARRSAGARRRSAVCWPGPRCGRSATSRPPRECRCCASPPRPVAGDARGHVLWHPARDRIMLYVFDLPRAATACALASTTASSPPDPCCASTRTARRRPRSSSASAPRAPRGRGAARAGRGSRARGAARNRRLTCGACGADRVTGCCSGTSIIVASSRCWGPRMSRVACPGAGVV